MNRKKDLRRVEGKLTPNPATPRATRTGLVLDIYRWSHGDCSAGGLSSRVDRVTLVDPAIDGPFEPTPDAPEVCLVRRMIGGREYLHVEPAVPNDEPKPWFMDGGTIVDTSDSRFSAVSQYPLAFHDRTDMSGLGD